MNARPHVVEALTFPTDQPLLDRVLTPYKERCKYLTSAEVTAQGGRATARCDLAVPESCYIEDTGHLNSVEVMICYNQMMYFLIAKSIKESLLPAFAGWTLDDYWERQLPDILIARSTGNFRRPVNARAFSGELSVESVVRRTPGAGAPLLMAETRYRCWDLDGGRCDGTVTLVLTRLPDVTGGAR